MSDMPASFSAPAIIKEIGRGKHGARNMSRSDAHALYRAMQLGQVPDLELGAILIALRIKGESVEEIAGFMQAAQEQISRLPQPEAEYAPILIPSYNGARKVANLTPLLALLLARAGAPVLMHGVSHDPGRVTSAEILQQLGYRLAQNQEQANQDVNNLRLALMPIEALAPNMAKLLNMRQRLGLRNSTHTLVKIIQPFAGRALRLSSYTHPEYLEMLSEYFTHAAAPDEGDIFLMRGTEGETVANAKRANQIDWFHQGERTVLVEKQGPVDDWPPMPAERDAASTAVWIAAALRGEQPVPEPIQQQVAHCLQVARALKRETEATAPPT